jgi:hypothetical protein
LLNLLSQILLSYVPVCEIPVQNSACNMCAQNQILVQSKLKDIDHKLSIIIQKNEQWSSWRRWGNNHASVLFVQSTFHFVWYFFIMMNIFTYLQSNLKHALSMDPRNKQIPECSSSTSDLQIVTFDNPFGRTSVPQIIKKQVWELQEYNYWKKLPLHCVMQSNVNWKYLTIDKTKFHIIQM